jgi:hypothetical protein
LQSPFFESVVIPTLSQLQRVFPKAKDALLLAFRRIFAKGLKSWLQNLYVFRRA